jgi:hypothetical protein
MNDIKSSGEISRVNVGTSSDCIIMVNPEDGDRASLQNVGF